MDTQSIAAFIVCALDEPPPVGAPSAIAMKPYDAMFCSSALLDFPSVLHAPLPQTSTGSFSLLALLPVG